MGTRSLTIVERDGAEYLCMYRQFDGFPEGHGVELATFLDGFKVVNGIGERRTKLANGEGCLAAQIVLHFKGSMKDGPVGQFYLYPSGTRDVGEEYVYIVRVGGGEDPFSRGVILIECQEAEFTGTPTEFLARF